tara:strand:+ start:64 stop:1065 length:1002 start_codon:yes stop_codon:yes gene_type:complete
MIYIIQPAGTFRNIHTNHFASVLESLSYQEKIKFIPHTELLQKDVSEYPDYSKFIIRLGAYRIQEVLNILKKLESKGHTVFPNYKSIKRCLNKDTFYQLCSENNIPIPKTETFTRKSNYKKYNFPKFGKKCIIKPSKGTQGHGIKLVKNSQVADELENLFATNEFYEDCDAIVQSYITKFEDKSQHIRVFCFLGEPTASITITNGDSFITLDERMTAGEQKILYDKKGNVIETYLEDKNLNMLVSNVNAGGVAAPYFPDEKLKQICRNVCKLTGIEFTAIDILEDKQGNYYVLESNVAPHLYKCFVLHHGRVNHPEMIFNYLLDKQSKGSIIL